MIMFEAAVILLAFLKSSKRSMKIIFEAAVTLFTFLKSLKRGIKIMFEAAVIFFLSNQNTNDDKYDPAALLFNIS